jgi:hypothetical protein
MGQPKIITVKATQAFDAFAPNVGRAYDAGFFMLVKEDADVYGEEADGTRVLLAKFRRNIFSPALLDLARTCFEGAARKAVTWRKNALGAEDPAQLKKQRKASHSLLAGYWDRRDMGITLAIKKAFPSFYPLPNTICRPTTFTRDHADLWERGLPWLQAIARAHKALAPAEYRKQAAAAKGVLPAFVVPGTPYTTVTVNHNWRTNTHTDKGDYREGLGNLAVAGSGWTGGYLGFPRFKVALAMAPGDFAVMRVHEYHCNTKIELKTKDATRLTFVCYLREKMGDCKKTMTLPNGALIAVP